VDADQVGKLLFGRACRLRLAVWIARRDKPEFFQSEPPKEVVLPSDAAKELGRLVHLGMLEEARPDGDRRVWYIRTDSQLWKIIDAATKALELN